MREIKFRAWNKIEKKMYFVSYGVGCLFTNGEYWQVDQDGKVKVTSAYGELMQYTGLKGKNGVEIYEGDILKISPTQPLAEIIFDSGCFKIKTIDEEEKKYLVGDYSFMCKVIGNIYE